MPKLTDTQLIVLSKASQREDGAAAVPDSMGATAARKAGERLIARKLMREVRAKPGMPVWRKGEYDRPLSLVILKAGRDAIGVADAVPESEPEVVPSKVRPKTRKAVQQNLEAQPRTGTKQAEVIAMLSKDKGASIDALIKATGWLPHTTRAVLTGLRKRGYVIERFRDEKLGSIYRITGGQKLTAAA